MRKFVLALLSGLLLALGWPTYGFPLLLFIGFVPLLFLENQLRQEAKPHTGWRVFGFAYLSFFVWNIITTYWLYNSTAAGAIFTFLTNSLLMALVFVIYHHIAKRISFLGSGVFLASLWLCFEFLHLHWDFSFPWLNLGNGFSEYPKWIQWYEYTGTFGGSFWVWLANLVVFRFVLLCYKYRKRRFIYKGAFWFILIFGIPLGISLIIWDSYPDENEQDGIEVLILQPNIDPYTEKYNTNDERVGQLLKKMTDKNISDSTRIVMAPETVFADGTDLSQFQNSSAYFYGEEIIDQYPNTSFMAGISFYKTIRDKDSVGIQTNFLKPGLWFNDYNSAFLLSQEQPVQIYNKSKLVVGVETFPYQNILKPVLGDIMLDLGGTVAKKTTQPHRRVFDFDDNENTAPIICYESMYGQFVNGYVKNGAKFLTIITNDAWWGDTQGHKQHASYARLRSIETRRDLARSANTGTSAIINQKGEMPQKTDYAVQTTIKGDIHMNQAQTFYMKHGDYIAQMAEIIALIILILTLIRKRIPIKI